MAKVTLDNIGSGYQSTSVANNNNNTLENELNNKVLYRDNPSGEANEMLSELDMNNQRITNLPDAFDPSEPATYGQLIARSNVAVFIGTVVEEQNASAGQTAFTLLTTGYEVGANNLVIYINGVRQEAAAYTETSTTTVTFTEGLSAGDRVAFVVNERAVDADVVGMSSVVGTVAGAATNVNTQLNDFAANKIYTFDTVAAMVAATFLQVGDVVITAGYTSKGDGGSNQYEIVAAATGTDDGGSFIDLATHQAKGLFPNGINAKQFGAVSDGATETLAKLQAAADYVSSVGVAQSSVVDLLLPDGVYIVDVSVGSATAPTLKLKNYTRLTGSGVIKAKDSSYTTGNPPIIGNDQTASGNTRIYIDGIGVDANATNNVSTTAGAISILFGRPVGASGGPGQVSVDKGAITNIKCVDTSFIAVQVKDGASQISISNIENNGGHYAVQAANSQQVDISNIRSKNTTNNAVDVYGNMGDKYNISGKTGTYVRGETVTGSSSGATGRLILDNGAASIQLDQIVGTFTGADTMTGGTSGATATFVSREFIKGNFTGSIRGVHVDGCLTGVFLETVSDVSVSDCVIKNPTGNGCIINRINGITSGNRITNFTVENAGNAGLLFSGEVTDNHCEISVDGATDGVRFNGSSYNSASDCKIRNVTNGYIFTGTGNKNVVEAGVINKATTGAYISSAGQVGTLIEKPLFVGVTTRLSDSGTDTRYSLKEEGVLVSRNGSANITPNLNSGTVFQTDSGNEVSANITINAPSGSYTAGQRIVLILRQDGVGGNTVTFNAVFKIKTAASTTANKRSQYEFIWTGVFWEAISELIDL